MLVNEYCRVYLLNSSYAYCPLACRAILYVLVKNSLVLIEYVNMLMASAYIANRPS